VKIGLVRRSVPYLLAFFAGGSIMILELVASRLVARHVGASLHVWTSVIGVVLGGICLGNALGGRLADRIDAKRAIGPLFAVGALLTLAIPWVNAVVGWTPGLDLLPWSIRTAVVVTIDFLVPATALGLISPTVAKVAVEQTIKTGSALGDVYFWTAVGSVVGTLLAGFVLMEAAATSTIVVVVAASLFLPGAVLVASRLGQVACLGAAACLAVGTLEPVEQRFSPFGNIGPTGMNPLSLIGTLLAVAAGFIGARLLWKARRTPVGEPRTAAIGALGDASASHAGPKTTEPPPSLADLAALAFLISLAFMSLEMVAGRLLSRHLGSSLFSWTSVITILLGGLSLGNYAGGKIADRLGGRKPASWLFLFASVMVLLVLVLESPPPLLSVWAGSADSALTWAVDMSGVPWAARIFLVTALVFFVPAVSMGTVSPVASKLAVDRLRASGRTGAAIGSVYAWGMVGSIAGTFLTGFLLIDVLGSKGLLLAISALMAMVATGLGGIGQAAWAGIPLGLCIIAFAPVDFLEKQAVSWGLQEPAGNPDVTGDGIAYIDESNYYYIKVENEPAGDILDPLEQAESDEVPQRRVLVLDNLIHGYFVPGHADHLEYDYEFIYALATRRVAEAKARRLGLERATDAPLKALFLGGGSYTFPRYLRAIYPNVECDVAEIDPAVTEANHIALDLPRDTPIRTYWGDARRFVEEAGDRRYDLVFGDAFNDFSVPWHLTTQEFNEAIARLLDPNGVYMINIIDIYHADEEAAEAGASDGQVEAVAAAIRDLGNARDVARALAGGLCSAWKDEGLRVRAERLATIAAETLRDVPARRADALAKRLVGPFRGLENRFQGDPEALAAVARKTIARSQVQRDRSAAAEAIERVEREFKREAARTILDDAGIRNRDTDLDRIVDTWRGNLDVLTKAIELIPVEPERARRLAESIQDAFLDVERALGESPSAIARDLIRSADERADIAADRFEKQRAAESLEARFIELGVAPDVAPRYAEAVSRSLEDVKIQGALTTMPKAVAEAARAYGLDAERIARAAAVSLARARRRGAFLGSWVETAQLTFDEVEIFGTASRPGVGTRETFVVTASRVPVDLQDLGRRPGDPTFEQSGQLFAPDPYRPDDRRQLRIRSQGIILTDDYAPVENLLAPVAASRASN